MGGRRPGGHTDRVHQAVRRPARVEVQQVARSLDGAIISEGPVIHVYAFRDGLITKWTSRSSPVPTESCRNIEPKNPQRTRLRAPRKRTLGVASPRRSDVADADRMPAPP